MEIDDDYCRRCDSFFPKGTTRTHVSINGKRKIKICPSCIRMVVKELKKQAANNRK